MVVVVVTGDSGTKRVVVDSGDEGVMVVGSKGPRKRG